MSKKLVISALFATACALTASFAFAAPPSSHGPAKDVSSMHDSMNHDAHGDSVSAAAMNAKSSDTNVGKAVSPVASDKNNGQDAHGDAVSAAAMNAKSSDTNVGKAVSPVASDKNNGKHTAKGHAKKHHHN